MKEKLNITNELLKTQCNSNDNISIWIGVAGSGKSQGVKKISNMMIDDGDNVIIFSQEKEYSDIIEKRIKEGKSITGLKIFENTLKNNSKFFGKNSILPILQDIYDLLNKNSKTETETETKTTIFIDGFTNILSSENEYINFLKLAQEFKTVGVEFILISQNFHVSNYIKELYLLNSKEFCKFKQL